MIEHLTVYYSSCDADTTLDWQHHCLFCQQDLYHLVRTRTQIYEAMQRSREMLELLAIAREGMQWHDGIGRSSITGGLETRKSRNSRADSVQSQERIG